MNYAKYFYVAKYISTLKTYIFVARTFCYNVLKIFILSLPLNKSQLTIKPVYFKISVSIKGFCFRMKDFLPIYHFVFLIYFRISLMFNIVYSAIFISMRRIEYYLRIKNAAAIKKFWNKVGNEVKQDIIAIGYSNLIQYKKSN